MAYWRHLFTSQLPWKRRSLVYMTCQNTYWNMYHVIINWRFKFLMFQIYAYKICGDLYLLHKSWKKAWSINLYRNLLTTHDTFIVSHRCLFLLTVLQGTLVCLWIDNTAFTTYLPQITLRMGLTISSLLGRLFGKQQMRILMGKSFWNKCTINHEEMKSFNHIVSHNS